MHPWPRSEHVLDVGLDEAADAKLWEYAAQSQRVIISKDEDFSRMVLIRGERVAVVWVRLGNCRKRILLDAFSRSLPAILERLQANDHLIELY